VTIKRSRPTDRRKPGSRVQSRLREPFDVDLETHLLFHLVLDGLRQTSRSWASITVPANRRQTCARVGRGPLVEERRIYSW